MAQQLLEAEPLPGPPSEPRPLPSPTTTSSTTDPTASSPSPAPSSPYSSSPPPITNIVFMGMGEPLHNAPAVFAAIDTLTHRAAFGLAASRWGGRVLGAAHVNRSTAVDQESTK